LKGARIGIARKRVSGYSPATDRIFEAAIEAMKELGAVIVDPADVPHIGEYDEGELEILLYEFKADLNEYLSQRKGMQVRTLKDIIAFNEREREREMPFFGQELFEQAEKKGPLTEKAYVTALARNRRLAGRLGIDAVIAKHRLDALVMPTLSPAWTTDLVNGDHFLGASSTPAAVAGYPSVTVPAGFAFGLPVGVSFVGRAWSEPTLLKFAYAYEQATKHRRPPTFAATVDTVPQGSRN
jgi:amidase